MNINHGTLAGYVDKRCRCQECRDANRDYRQDLRIAALRTNFAGYVHGRSGAYDLGCRCRPCRDAKRPVNAAANARRKARREVEASGG